MLTIVNLITVMVTAATSVPTIVWHFFEYIEHSYIKWQYKFCLFLLHLNPNFSNIFRDDDFLRDSSKIDKYVYVTNMF